MSYCPSLVISHTNHNQNKKAHRNGIKKPQSKGKTPSLRGVRTGGIYADLICTNGIHFFLG
jgi:hypothetical protein